MKSIHLLDSVFKRGSEIQRRGGIALLVQMKRVAFKSADALDGVLEGFGDKRVHGNRK